MSERASGQVGRARAVALLALLVGGLSLPGAARAGCHLPGTPGHGTIAPAHFDRLGEAGALGPEQEAPARPPAPCTGALCSGVPAVPVLPAPPVPRPPATWAILSPPAVAPRLDGLGLPAREVDARPIRAAAAIFHPPRLGPSPSPTA